MSTKKLKAVENDEVLQKMEEEITQPEVQEETSQGLPEMEAPSESPTEEIESEPVVEVVQETPEQEEPESDRAQDRIRKLSAKVKELQEKLTANQTASAPIEKEPDLPWDVPKFDPLVEAREIARQELIKEKIADNFSSDVREIERKYPDLTEDSPLFNKIISSFKNRFDKSMLEARNARTSSELTKKLSEIASMRLSDDVEEFVDLRDSLLDDARRNVTAKVMRQSAEQALAPTSEPSRKEATVTDAIKGARSIKELEQLESQLRY